MRIKKIVSILLSVSIFWWNLSFAAPEGGVVVGGSAGISQSGNTTTINQTSQNAVINWQGFNLASNEAAHFIQPNSNAAALNRITSGLPTSIAGTVTANGNVFFVNPAGILFTNTSRIDVGGILATTANIQNQDFMNGNYHFTGNPNSTSSVINNGAIKSQGLVALVGPNVENNGVITANSGKVILGSGADYTVDMYGDNLINFSVANTQQASISNDGAIYADGGQVLLTAKAASNIVNNVISMKGVIQANTISQKNGSIILSGGDSGTVNVSGSMTAHTVKVLGNKVGITGNAKITSDGGEVLIGGNEHGAGPEQNASATYMGPDAVINNANGRVILWSNDYTGFYGTINAPGGFVETSSHNNLQAFGNVNAATWLLDPRDVSIISPTSGGSFSGGNPDIFTPTSDSATVDPATIIAALDAGTSVVINTGSTGTQNGDITVFDFINKTVNNSASLTLDAAGDINIENFIDFSTNAGDINFNAGGSINLLAEGVITTGGNFNAISVGDFNAVSQPAAVTAGSVTINAGGAFNMDGIDISSTSGVVNITASTGFNITNANLTTSHINSVGGDVTITAPSIAIANGLINSGANNTNINITSGSPVTIDNSLPTLVTANSLSITATASNLNVDGLNVLAANIPTAVTLASSTGNVTFIANSSTFNQNLIVNAGGAITQAVSLSANTTSSFSAGANSITLDNYSNLFTGAVSLNNSGANDVTINASYTTPLIFNTSNIGGNLFATNGPFIADTAGGDIQQIGPLHVGGVALFNLIANYASGGGNITLTDPGNTFGGHVAIFTGNPNNLTPPLVAKNASLVTAGSVFLGRFSIINGDLTVAPVNGGIYQQDSDLLTQVGVAVTGTATFNAGNHEINLGYADPGLSLAGNQFNNFSGPVIFNNTGATNSVQFLNPHATILGASTVGGNFTVGATGAITQTGALTIGGTSSFSAGSNAITLGSANVLTGAITLSNSGANNVSLTTLGNLLIGSATIGNDLTLNSGDAVSQTGAITANQLTVNAVNGINLNNIDNHPLIFTATNTSSGDIVFNNTDPLTIIGITQSGPGNVAVNNIGSINITTAPITSNGGAISIFSNSGTGPIFVNQLVQSGPGSGGNLIIGQNVTFGGLGQTMLGGGNITINLPLPPPPPPPSTNPIDSLWWPPIENETMCSGNGCALIEVELALGDNGGGEPQVGVVNCVVGFATVLDQNGNERILAPGDKIYFNEKVVTDSMSSVTMRMDSGKVMKVGSDKSVTMDDGKV